MTDYFLNSLTMKTLLYLLFFVLIISCSSSDDEMFPINDEGTEIGDTDNMMNKPSDAVVSGAFVSDAHTTTGTASVNEAKTVLTFTNFMTDDGPKLLVYLSTDKNSTDYVDLGALKGISGNYEYTIPENTDLDKYKVVSIWCVDFLVSFGHAELN